MPPRVAQTTADPPVALIAVDGGNSKVDLALVAHDGRLLSAVRGPTISHQARGGTGPAVAAFGPVLAAALDRAGIALPAAPNAAGALARIAETTPSHEYVLAIGRLQALARRVVAWSLDYDAVLTPALAKLPVPVGWVLEPDEPMEQFQRGAEFTPFTPLVNVTGQPAIAVPFDVADGLPVAIQLIGRPSDEATLLRLASQLELARPWVGRLPHRFGEL